MSDFKQDILFQELGAIDAQEESVQSLSWPGFVPQAGL